VQKPASFLVLLTLIAAVVSSSGEELTPLEQTVNELRDRSLEDELAYELLRSLTTEVGHRFAGSPGDRAAVAWAKREMGKLGFDEVRTEPVTVPQWIRGHAEGEILAPYPQEMVLIALGGSVGTSEGGLTADVVRVASLDEL
jgi:hypothetical protein